jgi:hypothetical protein
MIFNNHYIFISYQDLLHLAVFSRSRGESKFRKVLLNEQGFRTNRFAPILVVHSNCIRVLNAVLIMVYLAVRRRSPLCTRSHWLTSILCRSASFTPHHPFPSSFKLSELACTGPPQNLLSFHHSLLSPSLDTIPYLFHLVILSLQEI